MSDEASGQADTAARRDDTSRSRHDVPDSSAIPVTPIAPIPLQAFRAPFAHLAMQWNRAMDAVGR